MPAHVMSLLLHHVPPPLQSLVPSTAHVMSLLLHHNIFGLARLSRWLGLAQTTPVSLRQLQEQFDLLVGLLWWFWNVQDCHHFSQSLSIWVDRLCPIIRHEDDVSRPEDSSQCWHPYSVYVCRVIANQLSDQRARFELLSTLQLVVQHVGSGSYNIEMSCRRLLSTYNLVRSLPS
ncbi:hypothetical protein EJ02DRAFT_478376 [Clathrospora elynae]|uniref:Uncharacterized protein n=1 Tax=Clathrospora elynae TaxID=706981 RepID=A0A6A5S8N7_9PLEO|nr:hypothetical protein EJ02DRAFT_478376 [Clathrospora elynae]